MLERGREMYRFLCALLEVSLGVQSKRKKGAFEIEEIVKIIVVLLVLGILAYAASFIFFGKGGRALASVMEAMRG